MIKPAPCMPIIILLSLISLICSSNFNSLKSLVIKFISPYLSYKIDKYCFNVYTISSVFK